jgi:large subunit ribosomal protein L3
MKFILGKKLGMTTIYDEKGKALNLTLIECAANKVTLLKTSEKNGYAAVQLEMPKTKNKKFKKEFRTEEKMEVGQAVSVESFKIGEKVKVSGITKAKGFQGVVKRHGFGGAPATHGRKHDHRKPGSIGSGFPEHVTKGKRMAGRMGGVRSSMLNVTISFIDVEKNLLGVRGAVPGVSGRIVEVVAK